MNTDLDFDLYEQLIIDTIDIFYEDASMLDQKFIDDLYTSVNEQYSTLIESATEEDFNETLLEFVLVQEKYGVSLGASIGGIFSKHQHAKNIATKMQHYHDRTKSLAASSKEKIAPAAERVKAAQAELDSPDHTFWSAHKARKEMKHALNAHAHIAAAHNYHKALVKHAASLVGDANNRVITGKRYTNRELSSIPGAKEFR